MGKVISLNISEKRGVEKTQVFSVNVIKGFGLEGDAHAGNWDRQISLLPIDALEKFLMIKLKRLKQGDLLKILRYQVSLWITISFN
jgi:hypothetical protein